MKLNDKVAIVTGASRGIGRCIAVKLAKEGAKVVLAAKSVTPDPRLPGTLGEVAKEIEAFGGQALAVRTNVREAEDIEKLVAETLKTFGRIDILINNAGALWWQPVSQTPAKRYDLVMEVNVRAAFLCAHAVLPTMQQQKWGHIINMSPPVDFRVIPGKTAYFLSKFGMTMMVYGLAGEVKQDNIAVNALWPATIIESLASINFQLGDPSQWRKPEIVADAVLAIVSKEPNTSTGQALIDEDVLRADGVTDFGQYSCVPGTNPPPLRWDVPMGMKVPK
jgi:citronellol/citronellal dehydrogenase